MHPRLTELFGYLDRQHALLLANVQAVPTDRHTERPAPDRWSVAEIVEHLVMVEGRLGAMIGTMLREAAPRLGPERDDSAILPTLKPDRALDRSRTLVAREGTVPTGTMSVQAGLGALDEARASLKRTLLEVDGLALGDVERAHPAFGAMSLYGWIAFVGAHMGRHALQVREVTESLGRPPLPEWYGDLAGKGLAGSLGIELIEISPTKVVATMRVDDRTRQPFGILHGGASIALAETVASFGAVVNIDHTKFMAVGQEINGNHLRGKASGVVTATGTPVHIGRTSQVWSIEIRDETEKLVCLSRCTLAIVEKR
jgi:uncharacterized protein (TIGR00369 family)